MQFTLSIAMMVCLLNLLTVGSILGHTINQNHYVENYEYPDWKEPKVLKSESVLMDVVKSLIGGKTTGDQVYIYKHINIKQYIIGF